MEDDQCCCLAFLALLCFVLVKKKKNNMGFVVMFLLLKKKVNTAVHSNQLLCTFSPCLLFLNVYYGTSVRGGPVWNRKYQTCLIFTIWD